MSFASEAAFSVPPVRRHFDWDTPAPRAHRRSSRSRATFSTVNILPNLRDASDFVYEAGVATAAFLLTPAFWLEEHADSNFDERLHPVPARRVRNRESESAFSKYVAKPTMAGATFMAALFAPAHFSAPTPDGSVRGFTAVSASAAAVEEAEEAPAYRVMYSAEWHRNRARLQAAYAERRALLHPEVEAAPAAQIAEQQVGGVTVTSLFEDEYSSADLLPQH